MFNRKQLGRLCCTHLPSSSLVKMVAFVARVMIANVLNEHEIKKKNPRFYLLSALYLPFLSFSPLKNEFSMSMKGFYLHFSFLPSRDLTIMVKMTFIMLSLPLMTGLEAESQLFLYMTTLQTVILIQQWCHKCSLSSHNTNTASKLHLIFRALLAKCIVKSFINVCRIIMVISNSKFLLKNVLVSSFFLLIFHLQ